jgi:hypothetical protein
MRAGLRRLVAVQFEAVIEDELKKAYLFTVQQRDYNSLREIAVVGFGLSIPDQVRQLA